MNARETFIEFVRKATDASGFRAQWESGNWGVRHGWLQIGGEVGLCLAFGVAFTVLASGLRRRSGTPHSQLWWILGSFLLACGLVHLMNVVIFWWPAYRLLSLATASAAAVGLAAASVMISTLPKVLALRSPDEFHREIAQRRRSELELRQVHAQLESVIAERTAQLASKNQEMEQFLNSVSHDLKSPVITCLGLTGLLRQSLHAGSVEDAQDAIGRIDRSINRMRQLIEDLLNLSRIGTVRFELADVNTSLMLRGLSEELRPRLEKAGAMLQIDGELPHVTADALGLTQVFENLINNAIKYGCDNAQPRIAVGSLPGHGEVRFYVRDNGRGIDPAHHLRIFEPFKRLQSDGEGSGMGLAIVMRIVKMHGGRVWIESDIGKGSTFWVALPDRHTLSERQTPMTSLG